MLGTGLGLGGVAGQTEAQVTGRQGQRQQAQDAGDQDDGRCAGDATGPGQAPGAGGAALALALPLGPARAHPFAEHSEHGREQADGDQDGDQNRSGTGETHDREERDAGDGQGGECDDDRRAGKDDGAAGCGGGAGDRLLPAGFGVGELFAVPGDDEQGVVDADRKADHQGQHGGGARHLHEAGDKHRAEQADGDAEESGQQRQSGGDDGAECDGEDHEGDDDADEFGRAARFGLREHGGAAQLDLHPRVAERVDRGGELLLDLFRHLGGFVLEADVGVGDGPVGRHSARLGRLGDVDNALHLRRLAQHAVQHLLLGRVREGLPLGGGDHDAYDTTGGRGNFSLRRSCASCASTPGMVNSVDVFPWSVAPRPPTAARRTIQVAITQRRRRTIQRAQAYRREAIEHS